MKDLELFFARYAEGYMASDVEAVSAMYGAPMFALRERRLHHARPTASLGAWKWTLRKSAYTS